MALGWERVRVVFETHETLVGLLEGENSLGIKMLVEQPADHAGLYFFPWHSVISIFNMDSQKELNDRAKKAMDTIKKAKQTTAKKET